MRTLLALLLVGSLTAPVFAGRCRSYSYGHRHHHGIRSYHYNRYLSGHFAPRVRHYGHARRHYPVRSWHLAHDAYNRGHHRYGYGYGYRGYRYGYDYPSYRLGYAHAWIKYHGKAYQLAPIVHRMSTVFTLEDEVFDGEPAANAKDADGAPHARTQPVGARFLVKR